MKLTDTAIKTAKPKDKTYKMFDGGGLFLEVTTKGSKRWRYKYRYLGKEKLLSLGVYPDVKLKDVRKKHATQRELLASGVDPSAHRQAKKIIALENETNTFELISREWHSKQSATWSLGHSERVMKSMERNLFPWLGPRPITKLKLPEVLKCIKRIEDKGHSETAHRSLGQVGQVFRYAVATGRATRDITAEAKGALKPVKPKHLAAVTDPKKVGELLRALDGYSGGVVVEHALKLAPLVFVRPGELRQAKWEDFNLSKKEWRYLVTKTNTEHIVPLSKQAVAILKSLYPITNSSPYVFPSDRSNQRAMSNNAILSAMRRMGISKDEMSGHGFRAMARTMLDEILEYPPHLIEHQLAHAVRDPNGRAYNRTAHLKQRHEMMQGWGDYLDKIKQNVFQIKAHKTG